MHAPAVAAETMRDGPNLHCNYPKQYYFALSLWGESEGERKADMSQHLSTKRRKKLSDNHLKKVLSTSERIKAEVAFEADHADWSDEQLFQWVCEEKRRLGRRMSPANTVGYRTLTKRLGEWSEFMTRVNQILEGSAEVCPKAEKGQE